MLNITSRRARIKGIAKIPVRRKPDSTTNEVKSDVIINDAIKSEIVTKEEDKPEPSISEIVQSEHSEPEKIEIKSITTVIQESTTIENPQNIETTLQIKTDPVEPNTTTVNKPIRRWTPKPSIRIPALPRRIKLDPPPPESHLNHSPIQNIENEQPPQNQNISEEPTEISSPIEKKAKLEITIKPVSDSEKIAPCPLSPNKINRARIRPIPKLYRRNSVQGSASESEDDGRRSRIRNDSICSTHSVSVENSVQKDTSPVRSNLVVQKVQKTVKRSEQVRKIAEARREFNQRYKSKIPDPKRLTMMDFIYYNPTTNPMPVKLKKPTQDETITPAPEQAEAEKIDDPDNLDEADDDEENIPVPQVKIGPDGEIILDEQSLVIEQTGMKKGREKLANSQVVNIDDDDRKYGVYKKVKRSRDWTNTNTLRFYKALHTVGTDFSLMLTLFPGRTRRELKMKFKKEERVNQPLIDKVLMNPLEFNLIELEKQFRDDEEQQIEAKKLISVQINNKKKTKKQMLEDNIKLAPMSSLSSQIEEEHQEVCKRLKNQSKPKPQVNDSVLYGNLENGLTVLDENLLNSDSETEIPIKTITIHQNSNKTPRKFVIEDSGDEDCETDALNNNKTQGNSIQNAKIDENSDSIHSVTEIPDQTRNHVKARKRIVEEDDSDESFEADDKGKHVMDTEYSTELIDSNRTAQILLDIANGQKNIINNSDTDNNQFLPVENDVTGPFELNNTAKQIENEREILENNITAQILLDIANGGQPTNVFDIETIDTLVNDTENGHKVVTDQNKATETIETQSVNIESVERKCTVQQELTKVPKTNENNNKTLENITQHQTVHVLDIENIVKDINIVSTSQQEVIEMNKSTTDPVYNNKTLENTTQPQTVHVFDIENIVKDINIASTSQQEVIEMNLDTTDPVYNNKPLENVNTIEINNKILDINNRDITDDVFDIENMIIIVDDTESNEKVFERLEEQTDELRMEENTTEAEHKNKTELEIDKITTQNANEDTTKDVMDMEQEVREDSRIIDRKRKSNHNNNNMEEIKRVKIDTELSGMEEKDSNVNTDNSLEKEDNSNMNEDNIDEIKDNHVEQHEDNNVESKDNNVEQHEDNNIEIEDKYVEIEDNYVEIKDNNVEHEDNNVEHVDSSVEQQEDNNVEQQEGNNVEIEDNNVEIKKNNVEHEDTNVEHEYNNVEYLDNNVEQHEDNSVENEDPNSPEQSSDDESTGETALSQDMASLEPGSIMILTNTDPDGKEVLKIYMVAPGQKKVPLDLSPDVIASLASSCGNGEAISLDLLGDDLS